FGVHPHHRDLWTSVRADGHDVSVGLVLQQLLRRVRQLDRHGCPPESRCSPRRVHGPTPSYYFSQRGGNENPLRADTTYSLDQFLVDTGVTIKTKGIPAGLAEIRGHLEKLLHNPDLLKKHLGDPVPYTERTTIGHDPETDVHVLVHGREKAGKSSVH